MSRDCLQSDPFSALRLWPSCDEKEAIRALLQTTYGDGYDSAEADHLLKLARKCFEDADALHEWPDIELWQLLCEAQERVEWLQELFDGQTPSGWKLPKTVVDPKPIPKGDGCHAMRVDDPLGEPSKYNLRLASSLSRASEGPVGGDLRRRARDDLADMRALLNEAAERIEPRRQPISKSDIRSALDSRSDRGTKRAKASRKRQLTMDERAQALLDDKNLVLMPRPFLQGRTGTPEPLINFVEAVARSWHRAFGTPPPIVRPPSHSSDADRFAKILRLFEAAYRRRNDELSRTVVNKAIARLKAEASPADNVGGKNDRI